MLLSSDSPPVEETDGPCEVLGFWFLGGPENSYRTSKSSWMGHALSIKDM